MLQYFVASLHSTIFKKYKNGSPVYDKNSLIQLKQKVLALSADETLEEWGEGRRSQCAAPQSQSTNEAMKTDGKKKGFSSDNWKQRAQ